MSIFSLLPSNLVFKSPTFLTKILDENILNFIDYYNGVLERCSKSDLQVGYYIWIEDALTLINNLPSNNIVEFEKEVFKFKGVSYKKLIETKNIECDYNYLIDIAQKYKNLVQSARSRNKEFNLTFNDVKKLIDRKTCYYTKVKFNNNDPRYVRTIDRKNASLGYVRGNVVACTHQANSLKEHLFESPRHPLSMSPEHLQHMLNKILSH